MKTVLYAGFILSMCIHPAAEGSITIGAFIPPTGNSYMEHYDGDVKRINDAAGKKHGILMHYRDWYFSSASILEWARKAGAVPFVNIASNFSYGSIINESHDTDLREMARNFKNFGGRILMCIDSEMNNSGKNPRDFIEMWRHVHDVFTSESATNIEWVWSPNYWPQNYTDYYPGGAYVDWVGCEGFDWKKVTSASQMFGSILADFASRYPDKPAIVSYMGADENKASDKADWIQAAYGYLPAHANLKAVIWWNDTSGDYDFRVTRTSSKQDPVPQEVTQAYGSALSSSTFISTLPDYGDLVSDTYIDLAANKSLFATSDYISITADVQPLSTPFYPYVRIIFPDSTTLYYTREGGFTGATTPYLGGGPFLLPHQIGGYPVLETRYSITQTGQFVLEGYATDSSGNLLGERDRETLTVH